MNLSAESIALSLDKPRRNGAGKYLACCPAHDDNSPSLSISDSNGKTLVHCFSGCSQTEVIDALKAKGLWPDKPIGTVEQFFTKRELLEMHFYVAICLSTDRPLTPDENGKLKAYRKVLLSKGISL